jgi:hypothetical protein
VGESEELVLNSFVVVFGPVLPTRFPGRKRQPSDDARTAPITPGFSFRSKDSARGAYLPPEASW